MPPAADVATDLWRLSNDLPLYVVCGELKPEERGKYASPQEPNHMAMPAFADQDSLVELIRHVSAANPGLQIQHVLPKGITGDNRKSNVVILGNMAWCQLGPAFADIGIPVEPTDADDIDGEIFEFTDERFMPKIREHSDHVEVEEDVAFFWRGPNPFNGDAALTICSGVFTRGVYGAVRLLTDPEHRDANNAYIESRKSDKGSYGALIRVVMDGDRPRTPILADEGTILAEFETP